MSYTLTATTLKKTSSKERAMMHRSKDMHKAVVMSIEINATITGTLHRTTIKSITGRSTMTTTRKVEGNGMTHQAVTLRLKLRPKQKLKHRPGLRQDRRLGLPPEHRPELRPGHEPELQPGWDWDCHWNADRD